MLLNLALLPAVISQNITNKSCLVCVKSEKYSFQVNQRPLWSMQGEDELWVLKLNWVLFPSNCVLACTHEADTSYINNYFNLRVCLPTCLSIYVSTCPKTTSNSKSYRNISLIIVAWYVLTLFIMSKLIINSKLATAGQGTLKNKTTTKKKILWKNSCFSLNLNLGPVKL